MRPRVPSTVFVCLATASVAALLSAQAPTAPPTPSAAQVTFAQDIQPIFEKTCWTCHSADLSLADLDLSTRDAALKGGEHGAAIVPGNAEGSKLYRMIAGLDQPTMPMEGDKLTP